MLTTVSSGSIDVINFMGQNSPSEPNSPPDILEIPLLLCIPDVQYL
jgi:hypothetical protein